MRVERRVLRLITLLNWVLFVVVTISGFLLAPGPFAWGIVAGGLIVTINFQLLYRSLSQALTPPHVANVRAVLGKYYIRFFVSAVIIFVLIADHYVHPLGLIIGLSVVVTSIFITTLNEIRRILFKEAA
ncbi:MAG: ATP synthase subunit I [Thermodesulfobacteriota bacterium]|nr:ATP synthase subunit I [Thermodesulfobacteriota bacterium]